MNHDYIEHIKFSRMASAIERCHAKPHLQRYSVGHHTHDVVTLLIHCWTADHEGNYPRAELIIAGHVHDAGEIVTGDVPSPIKSLMGASLNAVDAKVERWLGCHVDLTAEEVLYLEAADRFELWLWCMEEISRGNITLRDWVSSYDNEWEVNPLPPAFDNMWEQVRRSEWRHLSRKELNAIGGLS